MKNNENFQTRVRERENDNGVKRKGMKGNAVAERLSPLYNFISMRKI